MKKYELVITSRFKKDYKAAIKNGCRQVLRENPYQNPPSYEKLSGQYKDFYSRRINQQHRLVYKVDEDQKVVIILSILIPDTNL